MNDESSLVRVMAIKTLSDLSKDNLIPKAHFRMGLISEIGRIFHIIKEEGLDHFV